MTENFDFIEELKSEILKIKIVNEQYAENIAITVLSTFSKNVFLKTNWGLIPLNTWFITIADSSSGKSLPIREFIKPIFKSIKETDETKNLILPSTFTMESMIDYLSSNQIEKGIIIRDEVSTLFKETSGNSYNRELQEFLSQMYDGIIDPRFTESHGSQGNLNCYTTFFGASTPYIYKFLNESFFVQGLGNRILWSVYDKKPNILTKDDLFGDKDINVLEDRKKRIEEFASQLYTLLKYEKIEVIIPDDIQEYLTKIHNDFEIKSKELEKEGKSIEAQYLLKLFVSLLRLTTLKRLGKELLNMPPDPPAKYEITLTIDDVEWAKSRIDYHIQSFKKILGDMYVKRTDKPIESLESHKTAILGYIDKSPDGYATIIELQNLVINNRKDLLEVIDILIDSDEIEELDADVIKNLPQDVINNHDIKTKTKKSRVFKRNKKVASTIQDKKQEEKIST